MTNLEIVKTRLHEKQASLVVMFKDGTIEEYYNPRVQDIVAILKQNKDALIGATVADKVIGKVARKFTCCKRSKRNICKYIKQNCNSCFRTI